jgi:hypothetical protein
MTIAAALVLIAIGAILKWAITADVNGVNLDMIGVILMIVGAIGFVIALIMMFARRRTDVVSRVDDGYGPRAARTTYVTPADPDDPRL